MFNISALEKGLYRFAGQILAYMLVHRGPLPNLFHPFLYDALCYGIDSVRAEMKHVPDYDIRDNLQKV